jgi:ammonium transporter Rh
MIVVGFGFLMTFLKRYSWSSLGFNFLFTAFTVQWSMLVQGWFNESPAEELIPSDGTLTNLNFIKINLHAMIEAEFSTGAILISFGAVLGVASPVQLLVMIILEIVLYKVNIQKNSINFQF